MRGGAGGVTRIVLWSNSERIVLWPSSDTDFFPGLTIGDGFAVRCCRGFNVDEASERSSSSESSVSLSPLMLLELRKANVDGGRKPVAEPGESPSCEKEGTGEFAALRRA